VGDRKPAKYHNKKVHWGGMTFDSIREFERYQELSIMEKAGVIQDLQCQVKIKLSCGGAPVMSKRKKGHQYYYVVDFKYYDEEQKRWRFEDVKGYNTRASDIKIAVVEAETGTEIEIVR
jgi:hypothetical protein